MTTERREFKDWEKYYRDEQVEAMPWYYTRLDHDLGRALKKLGITGGTALDLGTGPGTQAMALAGRGFKVTATDISQAAVHGALDRTGKKGLTVDFRQDDIIKTGLKGKFDFVFDRGCFHVIDPDERGVYVKNAARLLKPGGYLFLKTFSHEEKMEGGPYRFRPEDITALFKARFDVLSIVESEFRGTLDSFPKALFAVMKKRRSAPRPPRTLPRSR